MLKTFFSILGLITCFSTFAQSVKEADSLLLNAEYDRTLNVADQYSGTDPSVKFLLQNKKAEALMRLGKTEESENLLKTLFQQETNSPFLRGVTKTTYSQLYVYQGRLDKAEELLKEALIDFENASQATSLEAAQAISQLGLVYKFTGKHAQAEEQMRMALGYRENLLKPNSELIAASFNDLGLIYTGIDDDRALDYYEKALAIYERLHGEDHPKIAIANSNIGFVYRNLQLYGDAVNDFENALKIWEKIYQQPHQTKAFNLYNLGHTYKAMGDQKAARGYFERALKMYKESYGPKHPEVASVLNDLGVLESKDGKYTQAIGYYQQALQANTTDFNNSDERANPGKTSFYNGNTLLNSLLYKAEAFEARYFERSIKFSEFENALKILQRCDTLIDELRQRSSNESDKISLGVIANGVYADGVRIANEAASVALNKRHYRELSFYFAEKSKSAVLLESISESDAKSFAGIPAPLLEEEKNMKAAIALTAQKLAQKPAPDEEKYLREALFSLNRGYEAFVRKLEKDFPSYFNLKFNAASPSIAQLQKLIDDNTAVLSYFVDDKKNRFYVYQITKNKFEITEHELPVDFDKLITGFRNGLFYSVVAPFQTAGNRLLSLLIPKTLPAKITDLVVIPTGRLGIIPFEALPYKSPNVTSFGDARYLIERFAIRYEFSAGLLLQKSKSTTTKPPAILLCAPVNFPEKDNLNDLPGTESEVKSISQLFASKNQKSALLLGAKANEQEVKRQSLKDYSLIHFATHGVVDEKSPELSRIFLQNNSSSEDGNLFAGEIYNLEMDANLVTLSACQTGLGKISKGEGVIGLSRALVYAGAKNIIVSFWSVADESTSELMKDFYQRLLNQPETGYSQTLREAKISLMKTEKYSSPYYWAPFILIGF
jgi:CHAT domain-containing protein/Tfp pilus assembly protein PilF